MGLGGISMWQLLIVLAIVILIFGTKRLKGLGGDVGSAIKSFKKAMNEDEATSSESNDEPAAALDKKEDAQFSDTSLKKKAKQTPSE